MNKKANLLDPKTYGKKAYIVDLWSDFVDYVPKAFEKFKAKLDEDYKLFIKMDDFRMEKESYLKL